MEDTRTQTLKALAPYAGVALLLAWGATPLVSLVACAAAALMLSPREPDELPRLPAFAAIACVLAFQAWWVTRGTFSFGEQEVLGGAYDSLARSLRHGSAEVRREDIQWEAWTHGGRTFMYFGPFPALLRVLPDLLLPSLYGRWSRASSFLALILCMGAAVAVARRSLADNRGLDSRGRATLFFSTLAAVGLGSSLLLVGSLANLYHEAILWGLAGALWGVHFGLGALREEAGGWRSLTLLSLAAGVAFLSRVTFGLPLYALLLGLSVRRLVLEGRRGGSPRALAGRLSLALLPAVAAGLLHLWYNHARFDSPFELAPFEAYEAPAKPKGLESPFHLSRIPSGALAYFRVSAENFSLEAPFLSFARPAVFRPELYRDLTTWLISPLLVSPWLAVALVGGLLLPGRRGERRRRALWALPFAGQWLLILAYYWLAYRFTAELLPLGLWFLAAYLRCAGTGGRLARLLSPRVFAVVAALSVLATVTSLFHFQSRWWAYPAEYREELARGFEEVDERLGLGE